MRKGARWNRLPSVPVILVILILVISALFFLSACSLQQKGDRRELDPNLEAALREELGKRCWPITNKDWAGLKKVRFLGRSIKKLNGLQHAVNLRELNLRRNKIKVLDPLSELPRLEVLILADNRIKELGGLNGPVLEGLSHLDLSINRIDDLLALKWDRMKSLTHLDIRYNYIDLQDRAVAELLSDLQSQGVEVLSEPMY